MQDETEIKLLHKIGNLNEELRQHKDRYKDLFLFKFSGPWDVDEYLDSLEPDSTKIPIHDSRSNNDDSER